MFSKKNLKKYLFFLFIFEAFIENFEMLFNWKLLINTQKTTFVFFQSHLKSQLQKNHCKGYNYVREYNLISLFKELMPILASY